MIVGILALVVLATSVFADVPQWGQCGGINYNGDKKCAAGLTCVYSNDWYSQCLLVSTTSTRPQTTPVTTGPSTTVPSTTRTSTATGGTPASSIPSGTLTQLNNFGPNPSNIAVYVYKPSNVKTNPALVVALHGCGGTASALYSQTQFKTLADQRGFLLLFGDANRSSHCWDVWTSETQKHDAGGDSLGIASAARYAINNWGVDPSRVFVTGFSSGAMLTNVIIGAYPDVFRAGSAYAGTPFACWLPDDPFYGNACVNGQRIKSPQEWGDLVRNAYPGYTGSRPKMQLWHGTSDDLIKIAVLDEEIKQWTNVNGISTTPTTTSQNTPISGYTKTVYGSGQVEAYRAAGVGHGIPWREADTLAFFGI